MATPRLLNAAALAAELSKLPAFSTGTVAELNSLRVAVARAIASGQDAAQLARDLNAPAGWQSVNFSQPPVPPGAVAPATQRRAELAPEIAPAVEPPGWISTIVPIALSKSISSRVVVLDHEPTALGGLELPAWARALSPAAVYGPASVASDLLRVRQESGL